MGGKENVSNQSLSLCNDVLWSNSYGIELLVFIFRDRKRGRGRRQDWEQGMENIVWQERVAKETRGARKPIIVTFRAKGSREAVVSRISTNSLNETVVINPSAFILSPPPSYSQYIYLSQIKNVIKMYYTNIFF